MSTAISRLAAALLCAAAAVVAPVATARAQQGRQARPAPPADDPPVHAAPPAPPAAAPPAPLAPTAAQPQPAPAAARKLPPPRPAPPRAFDPYRCHPSEDISCTVVRETPHGMVIVTLRTPAGASQPPLWSVVSGTPPGSGGMALGGTVYVVPSASPDTGAAHANADTQARLPANGAPIID